MTTPAWQALDAQIRSTPLMDPPDLTGLAEPITRYFRAALPAEVDAGPPTAAAVLEMRGHIRIGRWMPFRARQLLAPRLGTVWEASVAHLIVGSDRYIDGVGAMNWKLLGLVPIVRAEGPDVTRSAAARAAGESVWVPSAVAPGTGTTWTVEEPDVIAADIHIDDHTVRVRHVIDGEGRLRSSTFDRWGDPDRSDTWGMHPFGVEVSEHRRFGPVTIPSSGEVGWYHGTDRWEDGRFFRFEITSWTPWSWTPMS